MQLLSEYTVSRPRHARSLTKVRTPFRVILADGVEARITEHDDQSFHLGIVERVDQSLLVLVSDTGWFREVEGVRVPISCLDVSTDGAVRRLLVMQLLDALTFLFGFPLSLSVRPHDDRLVPETDEEAEMLLNFGTDRPFLRTTLTVVTPGGGGVVTPGIIESLLSQHAGTRIYADAVTASTETAKFRELWKVLESAFGLTDGDLLEKIADYEPVRGMYADGDLKKWLILRGRASHAQSKAGIRELIKVEQLCQEQIGNLQPIIERVITTKESWGYPTTGWLERLPIDFQAPRTSGERPIVTEE